MILKNIGVVISIGVLLANSAMAGGGDWPPQPPPSPRPEAPKQFSIHDEGHTEINCKKCNTFCKSQADKTVLLFKFDEKWLRYLCDKNSNSSVFSIRKYDDNTEE